MIRDAKFVHTNIVARDWRSLAQFYTDVFGGEPLQPERNLSGELTDAVTGIPGAHVQGIHLELPGYEKPGPTLEIFQYNQTDDKGPPSINQPGFAHIAFAVDSVEEARDEVLAHNGSALGEMITLQITNEQKVTLIYMRDPEGNIVELQKWS